MSTAAGSCEDSGVVEARTQGTKTEVNCVVCPLTKISSCPSIVLSMDPTSLYHPSCASQPSILFRPSMDHGHTLALLYNGTCTDPLQHRHLSPHQVSTFSLETHVQIRPELSSKRCCCNYKARIQDLHIHCRTAILSWPSSIISPSCRLNCLTSSSATVT